MVKQQHKLSYFTQDISEKFGNVMNISIAMRVKNVVAGLQYAMRPIQVTRNENKNCIAFEIHIHSPNFSNPLKIVFNIKSRY